MTTPKMLRATALIEWSAKGHTGILVHADRYQNTWILPGGGLEAYKHGGKLELPMVAAVREVVEETGLAVEQVKVLFTYNGAYRKHHVFHIRASGKLDTIKDSKEAPAFAVCGPDLKPYEFLCEEGYATKGLVISSSTKAILTRYYQPKASTVAVPALAAEPDPGGRMLSARIVADTPGSMLQVQVGDAILELTGGDIVKQEVDAVVNAANKHLANGSGVAGAIFKAAGVAELTTACNKLHGCPVGEAKITAGFQLKARHIIHAVGPQFDHYKDRSERADALLIGAYRSSLQLATQYKLQSIAFPSISTGIYGFPPERAAPLVMKTVIDYLREHNGPQLVRFVLWPDNLEIYGKALKELVGA